MQTDFNKALRAKALAGLALLALLEPATAVVYVGQYDPAYHPIAGLGWRASVELVIPTACGAAVGTQTLNSTSGTPFTAVSDCGQIRLQSVNVTLQDFPHTLDYVTLGPLTYLADLNADAGVNTENEEVFEVAFVAGVPVDFKTSMSLRVDSTLGSDNFLSLGFGLTRGAVTVKDFADATVALPKSQDNYDGDTSLIITFAPVPEPGSVVLMLAGLAGLAAVGRRRRRLKGSRLSAQGAAGSGFTPASTER